MPVGRFCLALDDSPSLTWAPTWTRIDSTPNLVASYQIDRGRSFELDRTDTGRATVAITDVEGVLDPTNSGGPYYGLIEPLLQAVISRYNPVDGQWYTRFRGWVEEFDYEFDPSQKVNRLVLSLVDIFEVLAAIEMQPDTFGDPPPTDRYIGQVFYDNANMDDRIRQVLTDALGATVVADYAVIFSGNVELYESTYSAGESPMTAVQEAADAEFPGVSNVYTDRLGRLAVHGRKAKFDPHGTWLSISSDPAIRDSRWHYREWEAGDGAQVAFHPTTTAQIRRFAFNRGLSKIINSALATPLNIADKDVAAQLVTDSFSIGKRGIRSWSAQSLLTKQSLIDGAGALVETKRFATYYVDNYKTPRNRVTDIAFRSMRPNDPRAPALWSLLSTIDIADSIAVTVNSPGGGGFIEEPFFVEGVHETVVPLGVAYDDVTLSLDLSPRAYFDTDPWPTSP